MGLRDQLKKEMSGILQAVWELIAAYKKEIIIATLIIVFLLTIARASKAVIFVPLLVALGSVSMIYNREIKLSVGIELVMLATVLCSVAYGALTGAVVGFVTLLFAELIGGRINEKTVISLVGIIIAGLAANSFGSLGITAAGIITTIIYDAIIIPIYLIVGSSPARTMLFLATHIIWNITIFLRIAPFIYGLMA